MSLHRPKKFLSDNRGGGGLHLKLPLQDRDVSFDHGQGRPELMGEVVESLALRPVQLLKLFP